MMADKRQMHPARRLVHTSAEIDALTGIIQLTGEYIGRLLYPKCP
jgi:hypothetical protein